MRQPLALRSLAGLCIASATVGLLLRESQAADEPAKAAPAAPPAITGLRLSHVSPDPRRMTICWESARDGDTVVDYGPTESLGQTQRRDEATRSHQAEIPIPVEHGPWFYRVKSGEQSSPVIKARGYEEDVLKVAVVGDMGYASGKWQEAILREQPHLLLSAGDNVGEVHSPLVDGKRSKDNIANFRKLIASSPELFQSIPFMPILGNHDREIRPRGPGPKPPEEPVYDVDATAFRKFFALPGDEWKWHFDLPQFGVRFIGLDLNHVQDHGTNWQTCHAYDKDSEQLAWYRAAMTRGRAYPYVITLNNEKLSVFRGLAGGEWWQTASIGSALVTGFGYFAERAMVPRSPDMHGWFPYPCFNTSVGGKGSKYPDPKSSFFASEDNYVLLSFARAKDTSRELKCTAELKSLDDKVLDEHVVDKWFVLDRKFLERYVGPPIKLPEEVVDPIARQPLVIRNGGTPDAPAVYDFAGLTIDLGLDVTKHEWIKDGDLWRSRGKLLGREPIMAGQTAGLFIAGQPLSVPRDVAAEKLKPEKKGFCYVAPNDLKPGQMGYADDGSVYFRWPGYHELLAEQAIMLPAPAGTSCVSIQCSHVVVKNLTVRYAANDGFNIHNKWVGVRLENVRAFSCGDEGISAHGEVEMTVVDSEIAFNGSAAGGVADVDKSITRYERCRVHDNLGAAFHFSGKSHTVVDTEITHQARDFSVAPMSTLVKERVRYEP